MHSDGPGSRRVPSLVALCQKVASTHVDSITNLGSEITFDLAKPILERCSPEQLLQIEDSSPHLQNETHDLWKTLCTHRYLKMSQRYCTDEEDFPETWKERYFAMQEAEARRLEELGNRLRSQRQEEAERKKEREVKLTDRLPPPKRTRAGWGTSQPKTLFQKTRSHASRIQKTVYSARVIPPMPTAKNYTQVTKSPVPTLLPPAPQDSGQPSRVIVNTVKRPIGSPGNVAPHKPPSPTLALSASSAPERDIQPAESPPCPAASNPIGASAHPYQSVAPPSLGDPAPRGAIKSPKKDPMACLFLPKHRVRPTKV